MNNVQRFGKNGLAYAPPIITKGVEKSAGEKATSDIHHDIQFA
jgi:hypothetical protein